MARKVQYTEEPDLESMHIYESSCEQPAPTRNDRTGRRFMDMNE